MKRTALLLALVAVASLVLGVFLAAVTAAPPSEWLAPQNPTGRAPRLIALLALGPIIIVAIAAVSVRLYNKVKPGVQEKSDETRERGRPRSRRDA